MDTAGEDYSRCQFCFDFACNLHLVIQEFGGKPTTPNGLTSLDYILEFPEQTQLGNIIKIKYKRFFENV